MKGRSGYTFYQIAVYAFTAMVTLEGIFLWNYHPYREAEGLVRERVGHWTILRAVATPVPESKSNPIQSNTWINYSSAYSFELILLQFCPVLLLAEHKL